MLRFNIIKEKECAPRGGEEKTKKFLQFLVWLETKTTRLSKPKLRQPKTTVLCFSLSLHLSDPIPIPNLSNSHFKFQFFNREDRLKNRGYLRFRGSRV
ncbi:hypothetical protein VNO80_12260 [Phaseolus coccineus]|uniref:Uncharacterized protein n=1 Tax=Phaseolus coccineus TaxID=3886 RepID=A0AAN9N644_PHACN